MNKLLAAFVAIASSNLWACQLFSTGQHCDIICDEETPSDHVCGTDGVTYDSKCEFSNAACKAALNGTTLHMSYYGECITVSTPCNVVFQHRCPTAVYSGSYVCGTDGRTYISECALAVARCQSLMDPNATMEIELDHRGSCEKITNASRLVDCSQYVDKGSQAIAIEGGVSAGLHLLTCSRIYKPVCSLESHTYSNECSFCHSLALRHQIIVIIFASFNIHICHSVGTDNCNVICDEEETASSHVCGTNGVTYASKCDLENVACKVSLNGTHLHLSYEGKCITLSTSCEDLVQTGCPTQFHTAVYVCGTDGHTYLSECHLAVAKCNSQHNPNASLVIDLDHRGACQRITNASRLVDCRQYIHLPGSVAVEGGSLAPPEIPACPRTYKPVCSLTAHQFSNECFFCTWMFSNHHITAANMTAYIAHDGACHLYAPSPIIG